MKAGNYIFKNKCIPNEFNKALDVDKSASINLILLENYVVFCLDQNQPSIYFLELDTERKMLIKKKKKPKKLNIVFSDEWSLKKLIKLSAPHRI